MIAIPDLVTKRFTAAMRELTIDEAIQLAQINPDRHELGTGCLLRFSMKSCTVPVDKLTVAERYLLVAHYHSHVNDDGGNFRVGDGRFLDYLDPDAQYVEDGFSVGEVGGDKWFARHILGREAEAMEAVSEDLADWQFAAIAVVLAREGEVRPDPAAGGTAYSDWLRERISVLRRFPESDAVDLQGLWTDAMARLHHIFRVVLTSDGKGFAVATPKGGEADDFGLIRFRPSACISELAEQLSGRA